MRKWFAVMKGLKFGKKALKLLLLTITIVMAVVLVASAWGGRVSPVDSRILPLVTLAMPLIYIINIVILISWLVVLRWKYSLISLAAVILSWAPLSTVCPLNIFPKTYEADSTFRVMSFNVKNFGKYDPSKHEPSKSMRYILDQDADFVLLQEGSHARDFLKLSNIRMMREELENKYPYHSEGFRDFLILSKYPYSIAPNTAVDKNHSYYGGVFAMAFDIDLPSGKQLRIINLHMRSIGMSEEDKTLYEDITKGGVQVNNKSELGRIKHSLYDKLRRAFESHAHEAMEVRSIIDNSPGNVILCGDFNESPSSYSYCVIRGDDMSDTFQDCGLGMTHTYNEYRLYFKIDHILYRGDLEAVDWKRDKAGDSDHYPQVATFVWK